MPQWRVDIQKRIGQEYWTNRYFVVANTLADAGAAGIEFVGRERAISNSRVIFDKMRVDDGMPNTDVYSTQSLDLVGSRVNSAELLPLFNVVRVDFNAIQGRPSRKYLRGILVETETVGFELSEMIRDIVRDSYGLPMVGDGRYVDVDGQAFVSIAVPMVIGMRQLRRGSKRRITPII